MLRELTQYIYPLPLSHLHTRTSFLACGRAAGGWATAPDPSTEGLCCLLTTRLIAPSSSRTWWPLFTRRLPRGPPGVLPHTLRYAAPSHDTRRVILVIAVWVRRTCTATMVMGRGCDGGPSGAVTGAGWGSVRGGVGQCPGRGEAMSGAT